MRVMRDTKAGQSRCVAFPGWVVRHKLSGEVAIWSCIVLIAALYNPGKTM